MAQKDHGARPRRRQFHCRTRCCLLKGCEEPFRPRHPGTRYCSEACRRAAERWRIERARKNYLDSERGKQQRRAQSQRYRQRCKHRSKMSGCAKTCCCLTGEGDHQEHPRRILCARPGCYELICPSRRSPLQKYCSGSCRSAVRRVLERERRWFMRVWSALRAARAPV